jgi:hypothetical protein
VGRMGEIYHGGNGIELVGGGWARAWHRGSVWR